MTEPNGKDTVAPTQQPGAQLQINPWSRISEIALRLGVQPVSAGHPPSIVAIGSDGRSYDIWEVVSAFLGVLEAQTKNQELQ